MKHDWYWADIKFREPQLKQVRPKIGSLMRLLSVGLNKQHGNAPDLELIPPRIKEILLGDGIWDSIPTMKYEKLTLTEILNRYGDVLTKEQIDKITATVNNEKK